VTVFSDILPISPDRICPRRPLPVIFVNGEVIGACSLRKIENCIIAIFCIDEQMVASHPFYYHFLYAGLSDHSPLSRILVEKIYNYNDAVLIKN